MTTRGAGKASTNGRVLPPPRRKPASKAVADGSVWVANVVKLAGVAMALNEALVRSELRPLVIALVAVMIAGVQALESIVDRVLAK